MLSTSSIGLVDRVRRAADQVDRDGMSGLVRRATMRTVAPAFALPAARQLRHRGERAVDLVALIELAFEFDSVGVHIRPGQVRREIQDLLGLLQELRPERILEIGTQHGGSLFLFAHTAPANAQIISVDLPKGAFGGGYPMWRGSLYRRFGRSGQRIELIRADSHADATVTAVERRLAGAPLDFLFIDGDHSHNGVRADFERYGRLVRVGGLIGIHDIAPARAVGEHRHQAEASRLLSGDVPQFWQEIRNNYTTTEFQASEYGYFGIGVVRVEATR